MFPLQATYHCQPLPLVNGSPILRVLRADLTPSCLSAALLLLGQAYLWLTATSGCIRVSQVLAASLHAYHALRWTPADPREPDHGGSSAWASSALKLSPSALVSLTGLYQASGSAVSLTVYVIPCVRFNRVVRCACTSFTAATLSTSGWLDLTRQGLSPCKKHQASLGALTPGISGAPGTLRIKEF